jgi:hypothetical protein
VDDEELENEPVEHWVHAVEPEDPAKLPAGQLPHDTPLLEPWNEPEGQRRHEVEFSTGAY